MLTARSILRVCCRPGDRPRTRRQSARVTGSLTHAPTGDRCPTSPFGAECADQRQKGDELRRLANRHILTIKFTGTRIQKLDSTVAVRQVGESDSSPLLAIIAFRTLGRRRILDASIGFATRRAGGP